MARTRYGGKDRINCLLAQYKECYEDYRQHDRFIWKIPSIIVVINGALIAVAYKFISQLFVKEALLVIGALLTFALLFALIKHRYFAGIFQGTLTEIENKVKKELGLKLIQRTTTIPKGKKQYYWFSLKPSKAKYLPKWVLVLYRRFRYRRFRKLLFSSAHNVLINITFGIFWILIALIVLTPFIG